MRRSLLAWTVDADETATRTLYSRLESGSSRRCGCPACLNFDAARPENYPDAFRRLLESLEIEPRKEASARLVTPLEGRQHLYAGTYGFCGQLLAGRPFRGFPVAKEEVDVFERLGADAHVALKLWQNPPPPWSEAPCVRLEFLVVLPWVLEGPGARARALTQPLTPEGGRLPS